ncbi:hypothetical protein ACFELO_01290 [Oceanicaulis sp. LC35]|uniref:hypothetical protein n=1 Tax=Oceanicaulis sp. LC35 TaxID=3349635 RepID=UPI003F85A65C
MSELWRVFGWPLVILGLSLFGLIVSLVGNGVWDAAGWIGLFSPLAILVWARFVRAPSRT